MYKMSNVIIGCGTGRCGTMSLARVLSGCKDTEITHENLGILPWEVSQDKYRELVIKLKDREHVFKGDVAFYYLNYIDKFIEDLNAKIIVLKRNKTDLIKSFLNKTGDYNHFNKKGGNSLDIAFPKYSNDTIEDCYNRYYGEYYKKVEEFRKKYPNNIIIFNTEDLSNEDKQKELFRFCNINEVDMQTTANAVFNEGRK